MTKEELEVLKDKDRQLNKWFNSYNELIKENKKLKAELKAVKVCTTCGNYDTFNLKCQLNDKCKNHHLWEVNK